MKVSGVLVFERRFICFGIVFRFNPAFILFLFGGISYDAIDFILARLCFSIWDLRFCIEDYGSLQISFMELKFVKNSLQWFGENRIEWFRGSRLWCFSRNRLRWFRRNKQRWFMLNVLRWSKRQTRISRIFVFLFLWLRTASYRIFCLIGIVLYVFWTVFDTETAYEILTVGVRDSTNFLASSCSVIYPVLCV